MKKNRIIWNYIDIVVHTIIIFAIIIVAYHITENLERYIYRYTVFPFIAFTMIFLLGIILGSSFEKTKKRKPVGIISKKMSKLRKKKNLFIFSDNGQTYTPNKEIVEEIKSGEIVHIKKFEENDFEIDQFEDIYKINMDNIVDMNFNKNKDEENE